MISRHRNRAVNGGYNFAPALNDEAILNDYQLGEKVSLDVRVQKLLYRKEDTGWSIYLDEMNDWYFKINGVFVVPLMIENYYTVTGKISEYNDIRSLNVETYKTFQPEDEASIINILRTIEALNIKAPAVYKKYGKDILKDIVNHPRKVAKKLGCKESEVKEWGKFLNRNQSAEEAFEALKKYGVSDAAAKELLERYGGEIFEIVEENPYFLIDEVASLTFK